MTKREAVIIGTSAGAIAGVVVLVGLGLYVEWFWSRAR